MTNENERPSHCSDMKCTCIWHNHTEAFCVGSIEERVDLIDGKEHTNDRRFCIHTASDDHHLLVNKDDMCIIARAMFAALSTQQDCFNLHWFFAGKAFKVDEENVVVLNTPLEDEEAVCEKAQEAEATPTQEDGYDACAELVKGAMTVIETVCPPISDIIIYGAGARCYKLCAHKDTTLSEITAFINKENPTGLGHDWELSDEAFFDGSPNPGDCGELSDRRHYLFKC